ncbi:MAG: hypothetical protein V1921_02240, partial [Candidatus Altiarchaeota archaeon]
YHITMTTLTLSFDGVYERIIDHMLSSRMAKTKSEAVRMALLYFGMNTGALKSKNILESIRTDLSRDSPKRSDIAKEIERAKHATVRR